MAITPFKIYQVKNKAKEPSYVYMGKPYSDVDGKSFYPHILSEKCEDVYLFTTLVGSKNVRFTPSTLVPKLAEGNPDVLKDPFIHVDTRWYHFRYPGIENDVPENLPPNDFIKYHSGARGDYTVEWRKLTSSDGSVLIKPSLSSTVFWNGNTYIKDADAGYFKAPYAQDTINDDLIYLKTRHYLEVIRNTIKSDSLSIIYKKYIDECKWKSTYLMKRFRGSYCIDVKDSNNKSVVVGIKTTEDYQCECGCISCWEIINDEAIKKYSTLYSGGGSQSLIEKWADFKQYTSDIENNTPVEMTWIEQFEYNWLQNMGYNRYGSFPIVIEDPKTVEIKFNKFSDRQNRFYGINSRTATREHHAMPPVKPTNENPHIYSYENTHSLFHPDLFTDSISGYTDRYATTPTKLITKGRIDDGKERVVVPPGVIFRTFKAVPGVLSLYELDVAYRRPDEYHFAVDGYGNILGYKNLPFPGLIHTEYPVEDVGIVTTSRDDPYLRGKITDAWNCYVGNGKTGFCSEETIDDIHKHRVENKYIVFPKTLNPQDKDGIQSCETMTGFATPSISADDVWSYTGSLLENRRYHASVELADGKILVMGGYDKPTAILNTCEIYDPTFGVWVQISSMNERRHSHTATLLGDGRVLVTGGYNETGSLNSIEIYDPLLDTWSYGPALQFSRQQHTICAVNGFIVAVGGFSVTEDENCPPAGDYLVECESISAGSIDNVYAAWDHIGNIDCGRVDHTTTVYGSNALIYGGKNSSGFCDTYSTTNGILVNNAYTVVPVRAKHTAHNTGSGIVFIGGYDYSGALSSCELFNGSTFTSLESMNGRRYGHTSVLDGNYIHVVGGSDDTSYLKTTEIYDIINDVWYVSKDTNTSRFGHTSHYLNTSETMVIGGGDDSIINEVEIISGGGTHTYVNVHHCPIWIDKDIFCSYLAVENPKRFDENTYGLCGISACPDIDNLSSSSSSSSSDISSSSSSSSSIDDGDRVTIIVEEDNDDEIPKVSSSSSSTEDPGFITEPIPPTHYNDDLSIVNEVHGFIDITVAGNYTYTVPTGVKKIKILLWGAGAGGGGYAHMDITNIDREHSLSKASGGGGGAGGHLRVIREVSETTTYTLTVGAGGDTGAPYIVEGKMNSDMTTTWHDANKNVISEPAIIKAADGGNGGDSIFGGNYRAYGGRGGVGATVQKTNGLPGDGGVGSPGGTSYILSGVTTYKGNNGSTGEFIYEGPKGPALFGGAYGFAVSPSGGLCQIDGAGAGDSGRRNHVDTYSGGQDGRIRIEW